MKVTEGLIETLMKRVTVTLTFHDFPTKHAVAIAWLDSSFKLAEVVNKAVDPANFSEELATQYATEEVTQAAKNKLWEMEGYKLYADHFAPSTFIERLQREYDENNSRLVKLDKFLSEGKPDWMSEGDWTDLRIQQAPQREYVHRLKVRLTKATGLE